MEITVQQLAEALKIVGKLDKDFDTTSILKGDGKLKKIRDASIAFAESVLPGSGTAIKTQVAEIGRSHVKKDDLAQETIEIPDEVIAAATVAAAAAAREAAEAAEAAAKDHSAQPEAAKLEQVTVHDLAEVLKIAGKLPEDFDTAHILKGDGKLRKIRDAYVDLVKDALPGGGGELKKQVAEIGARHKKGDDLGQAIIKIPDAEIEAAENAAAKAAAALEATTPAATTPAATTPAATTPAPAAVKPVAPILKSINWRINQRPEADRQADLKRLGDTNRMILGDKGKSGCEGRYTDKDHANVFAAQKELKKAGVLSTKDIDGDAGPQFFAAAQVLEAMQVKNADEFAEAAAAVRELSEKTPNARNVEMLDALKELAKTLKDVDATALDGIESHKGDNSYYAPRKSSKNHTKPQRDC